MDINQQLQPIVAGIIDNLSVTIEQELRERITTTVLEKLASTELTTTINELVREQLSARLEKFNFAETSSRQLTTMVDALTSQVERDLAVSANKQINDAISRKIAAVDLTAIINEIVGSTVRDQIQLQNFPERSIPHTSINFSGMKLTGNQLDGGIISNFGSTGIEDRATFVQLTLMDHACAFEGPVFAPSANIKGTLTVDGDLVVLGTLSHDSTMFTDIVAGATERVRESLNEELFVGFSDIVHSQLKKSGLDLDKITQGGREIIRDSQLGYHITDSNLQRVGVVRDLQTTGENLLSDTLYVSNGRVGLNTIDPSAALSVWDEEVEIVAAKRKQDTAYIGTLRRQSLILGSNNTDGIVLDSEGQAHIKNLVVGKMPMSSAAQVPNYPGTAGQIVWNEQPSNGRYIGWVCLGATRWAGFGQIE